MARKSKGAPRQIVGTPGLLIEVLGSQVNASERLGVLVVHEAAQEIAKLEVFG